MYNVIPYVRNEKTHALKFRDLSQNGQISNSQIHILASSGFQINSFKLSLKG